MCRVLRSLRLKSPEGQRRYLHFKKTLPVYFLTGSLPTTLGEHRPGDVGSGGGGSGLSVWKDEAGVG